MTHDTLRIQGAREHNLKNINLEIPRNQFVVFTGISGSGKSSLAFDTIYAEGQRRYVESLSAYARQFLGQMVKPDYDAIEGLSPAISIDQKSTSRNPRSTVGTVTEIYDYLRLLYARVGTAHCPECGKVITQQTIDQMVDHVTALQEGTRVQILSPVIRGRKGEHQKLLDDMRKSGYVRIRVDGEMLELSDPIELDKNKKHTLEVVIDRLVVRDGIVQRLTDSLETALKLADGLALALYEDQEMVFSQNYSCDDCGVSIEELEPRVFSFNSPFGACPSCGGLGMMHKMDPDLIIPNPLLSLNQGAVQASGWATGGEDSIAFAFFHALADHYHFSLDTPVNQLDPKIMHILMYGTGDEKIRVIFDRNGGQSSFLTTFEGILTGLERRYAQTTSEGMKERYESYMSTRPCHDCQGQRLKKASRAVTVGSMSLPALTALPVNQARKFLSGIEFTPKQAAIAAQILKEINARLGFLVDVGLDYLTLARAAGSLSGGEAQRIRLATQIGTGLTGVLYILDEPSIGLHQRDNGRLLRALKNLRDAGNSLIVVEHDEETMLESDYIVDIGPGAGIHGGHVVACGTPKEIMACTHSITGQYLSGAIRIPTPKARRQPNGKTLRIRGARANNLRGMNVDIPLGLLICVTGVSGSGKSSLVNEIIYKALANQLNGAYTTHGPVDSIEGQEHLDKVIDIDQSPIGRTPRSNPATYTGLFDLIRDVFAMTPDAKIRGYKNGRFSFNVKGGRCEACGGDGILRIEMHFLPDVFVPCEICRGKRYNRETLEVLYKGKNIHDVLEMTVEYAREFFSNLPRLKRKLDTLYEVGLGYIKLGQPSTTLSGGEAQRVKLATELSRRSTGRTIYILDEPTTGLHSADVHRLVDILQQLAEGGNSVLVIEHNLDVIKNADYILDLGPEGGAEGGLLVAAGTPEQLIQCGHSYTGQYLKRVLDQS